MLTYQKFQLKRNYHTLLIAEEEDVQIVPTPAKPTNEALSNLISLKVFNRIIENLFIKIFA